MHLRYENQNVSRCQEQNIIPRIKIVSQNLKPIFRGRYSDSLYYQIGNEENMLLLHEIQGVPEKTHVREKLIPSLTGDFLGYLVHYMIMLSNANPHFLTIIIITLAEKRHNCSLIYKTQFLIIFVSL